jgi:hypothetical protein
MIAANSILRISACKSFIFALPSSTQYWGLVNTVQPEVREAGVTVITMTVHVN